MMILMLKLALVAAAINFVGSAPSPRCLVRAAAQPKIPYMSLRLPSSSLGCQTAAASKNNTAHCLIDAIPTENPRVTESIPAPSDNLGLDPAPQC